MTLLNITKKTTFILALISIAACTSIDSTPFQKFNASLVELDKGATSTLDITIPMSESRYRKELESDVSQGNDELLNQLAVVTKADDPFYISQPPVFLKAKKFKLGISKTNLVWLEYSELLLKLSSNELVDEKEFAKLSTELNANAFDAIQSFNDDPSEVSAENTALFSTLAIDGAQEYIKKQQKDKLIKAVKENQASIENYVSHMQAAIVTMAQSSTQEHSEKQQDFNRELILLIAGNTNGKNKAKIQKVMTDMIEVKTVHSEQMASLHALHTAYGKIPAAHKALETNLDETDTSLAGITGLLEKSVQLHASYQTTAKVNKAELVQAKADAANGEATAAEFRYQQAELKASQAQFEYVLAQNESNEEPDNNEKKKDAEAKKKIADDLRVEADLLKESATALRASATGVQESANEVKNSISQ